MKGGLEDCPFCDKSSGVMTCDACKGSGADSLGECLMCTGKVSGFEEEKLMGW